MSPIGEKKRKSVRRKIRNLFIFLFCQPNGARMDTFVSTDQQKIPLELPKPSRSIFFLRFVLSKNLANGKELDNKRSKSLHVDDLYIT